MATWTLYPLDPSTSGSHHTILPYSYVPPLLNLPLLDPTKQRPITPSFYSATNRKCATHHLSNLLSWSVLNIFTIDNLSIQRNSMRLHGSWKIAHKLYTLHMWWGYSVHPWRIRIHTRWSFLTAMHLIKIQIVLLSWMHPVFKLKFTSLYVERKQGCIHVTHYCVSSPRSPINFPIVTYSRQVTISDSCHQTPD